MRVRSDLTVLGCHFADMDGNGDGSIDIVDIMLVAVHWGEGCE